MQKVTDKNPVIKAAFDSYQKFHLSPELRSVAESCERFHLDAEAYADSREAEGEARGKALGVIEGKALGIIEGEARGKAEGLTEGKVNIAISLLEEGLSIEFIAKVTGLSQIEIKKLSGD